MQIKHAEIDVIRRVREGELPPSALDGLIDRARREFPRPGELLLAVSRNPKVAESARNAIQEVLETCWNVLEFHAQLRLEEERGDRAHIDHARAMLDVWLGNLEDSLGPQPQSEEAEEEPERPHPDDVPRHPTDRIVEDNQSPDEIRAEASAAQDPGKWEVLARAPAEPAEKAVLADSAGPAHIDKGADLGLLRGTLTEEELELAREIAQITGYAPSVEIAARGVTRVLYRGPQGAQLAYLPPKGTEKPILYALSRIANLLRRGQAS